MHSIRERFEQWVIAYSDFIYRHAKAVLLSTLTFLLILAVAITQLNIDLSVEGSLHESDPLLMDYKNFKQTFGRDDLIVIAVDAQLPLSDQQLSQLRSLHDALLSGIPLVKKVNSLHNARLTYAEDDELYVDDLLDNWPYAKKASRSGAENKVVSPKPQNLAQLSDLVSEHRNYRDNLIAADGSLLVLTIELQAMVLDDGGVWRSTTQMDNEKSIRLIQGLLQEYAALKPKMAGSSITVAAFNDYTLDDMSGQSVMAVMAIVFMLMLFFRRLSGVLLPLMIVQFSIVSVLGTMALCGTPMKSTTNAVIVLMYAVAACDAVHVLTHFYQQLEKSHNKQQAIAYALSYSAPAILLTSLTTAAGFLSFAFAELAMIAEMGIYAAVGVAFALFYTFTLLPAVLAIFSINAKIKAAQVSKLTDSFLEVCIHASTRYPKIIVAVFFVAAILALTQIQHLNFSDDTVSYFPDEAKAKQDLYAIDRALNGSSAVEIIIDSGEDYGLYNPQLLMAIDQLTQELEGQNLAGIQLGRIFSINDIIKETHQSLNANDPDFYRIPTERALIAQEILLFQNSGSDDLNRVADDALRLARITIKLPYADGVKYQALMAELQQRFDAVFVSQEKPLAQKVTVTGATALLAGSMPRAIQSMSVSYVLAFVVISFFMVLMAGNLWVGLLSMIPNVLPIIFGLALMAVFDVDLDMTSIMIGCIALGIVVDDTLHFIYHYSKNIDAGHTAVEAIQQTLHGAGRAMLVTTCVLVTCFLTDLFATLSNVFIFGTVVAAIISMALITDLLLAPALMMLLHGKRQAGEPNNDQDFESSYSS